MGVRILPQHLTIMGALVLALTLVALLSAADPTQAFDLEEGDKYRTGQVIVKLEPAINDTLIAEVLEGIKDDYGTTILDDYLKDRRIYLLETPPDKVDPKAFEGLLTDLEADPRVRYAEPNFLVTAPEPEGDARMRARVESSSSGSSDQYAYQNLGLEWCEAPWPRRPGRGLTVAVLDTGAQLNHPDLKANFKEVKRYDFVDNDTNPSEHWVDRDSDGEPDGMTGHGTHVAGIVDRVAPKSKIMPLRVLDAEGFGDVFTVSRGIRYASRNGADVINLSLGMSRVLRSESLYEMVKGAINQGVVVAAAAGNSNTSVPPHYPAAGNNGLPASADGLIAVTSVGEDEQKSDFANYGLWVDVAAPGELIRSAFPDEKYADWSGTSMSTPFVSGQAALVDQVYGSIKPASIEKKIRRSARDISLKNVAYPGWTAGHADVCASLDR